MSQSQSPLDTVAKDIPQKKPGVDDMSEKALLAVIAEQLTTIARPTKYTGCAVMSANGDILLMAKNVGIAKMISTWINRCGMGPEDVACVWWQAFSTIRAYREQARSTQGALGQFERRLSDLLDQHRRALAQARQEKDDIEAKDIVDGLRREFMRSELSVMLYHVATAVGERMGEEATEGKLTWTKARKRRKLIWLLNELRQEVSIHGDV